MIKCVKHFSLINKNFINSSSNKKKNIKSLISNYCRLFNFSSSNNNQKLIFHRDKYEKLLSNKQTLNSEHIYNYLFAEFDFHQINTENKLEKIRRNLINDKNFIYGEASFQSISDILNFIENKENNFFMNKDRNFMDIGSGIGKAVLGMCLFNKFERCLGVEIMENLHFKSELIKEKFEKYLKCNNIEKTDISEIEFLLEDILNIDFSKYDVIFANSTCWTKEFINSLYPKITQMKKGSFFINTDQNFFPSLSSDTWIKYTRFKTNMSWGESNVYVIKKISEK